MHKVVVRSKHPRGFWSAGVFWPHEKTSMDLTDDQLADVLSDRTKGFLEVTGGDAADLPEEGAVSTEQVAELIAEIERRGAEIHRLNGVVDAAKDDLVSAAKRIEQLEAELVVARVPTTEPAPADEPSDSPKKKR